MRMPSPPNDSGTELPRQGSADSQDVLDTFLRQQPQLEKRLKRWVSCRSIAADLCQELFIRLWRRRDVQVENLDQYMMRSARNLAIDHLRTQNTQFKAEPFLVSEDIQTRQSMLEDAEDASRELDKIEEILRKLPERTRHIFLLNRIHGLSYTEIASTLDLSVSAVEKHMMRALQACKRRQQGPQA